jgi:Flp pilus assembly protein TadG
MRQNDIERRKNDRGAAMIEMALTLPLLLLLSVSVFEFGRAFQTWQVLTNAPREGARVASLPGTTDAAVSTRVQEYLTAGQLPSASFSSILIARDVVISIGGADTSASRVTVNYPFEFMVLQPVAGLVVPGTDVGEPITLSVSATMRNE